MFVHTDLTIIYTLLFLNFEIEGLKLCNTLSITNEPVLCQIEDNYNLNTPPLRDNETLYIKSFIDIIDIGNIDENHFLFKLSIQLTVSWFDYRLSIKSQNDFNVINFDTSKTLKVWQPHVYIYDLKNIKNYISLQNKMLEYCKIQGNTSTVEITISNRFEVDITCGFNHSHFPFDTQYCLFRYGIQGKYQVYTKNFFVI